VKGNKKLHNLINFLAERSDLQNEFKDLDDIENKFSYAINACPTNLYEEVGSPLPTIPSLSHYNAPKAPPTTPVYAVPDSRRSNRSNRYSPEYVYYPPKLLSKQIISSSTSNTYANLQDALAPEVEPAPGSDSRRSNPSSRGSVDSGDSGYVSPPYALHSLSTPVPASPQKKSELQYTLEEYKDRLSLNEFAVFYDDLIKYYRTPESIPTKNKHDAIMNDIKKVIDIDIMAFKQHLEEGQKQIEDKNIPPSLDYIKESYNYLYNHFTETNYYRARKLLDLVFDINKLLVNGYKYKVFVGEVEKRPIDFQAMFRKMGFVNLVFKKLRENTLKDNKENAERDIPIIDVLLEKHTELDTFEPQYNKCKKNVSKVLDGEDIDVKSCFEGDTPLIINMKLGLNDDNGLCSKLKKKSKGRNPFKTKKRKQFEQTYKKNCEKRLRKSQIIHQIHPNSTRENSPRSLRSRIRSQRVKLRKVSSPKSFSNA
jgi:hypothetical protein